MVLVAVIPTSFHSPAEFLASFGIPILVVAYLAVMTCFLLKDHIGAWVLFGAFAFGGRAAAALLSQPAGQDQAAGGIGAALVLIGAIALLAGRRQRLAERPAPTPEQGSDS
jgi:predicted phage tail protein